MSEYQHDPPLSRRPEPAREIMVRAHRHMLQTETPQECWLRQGWETTISAVRVALDAWRELWPVDGAQMERDVAAHAAVISTELENLYHRLDGLSRNMLGDVMQDAQMGHLTTLDLDRMGVE